MVDSNARYINPEGVGLAIAVLSPIVLLFSIAGVAIRVHMRRREGALAVDDALLIGGLITYIVDTCLAVYSSLVGIGAVNSRLNAWMKVESEKYYIIWILVYVIGLAQIKSSICATLWRIGRQRKNVRITLYFLMSLIIMSFLVTFIGVLLFCSPIEANWDTSLLTTVAGSHCGTMEAMIGISHTATVTTIVTDIGCAVLPGVLLWKTSMRPQAKREVFALMSIASLASISTIARAPFISHYNQPENDLMYYVGYIVLFSNIETGIGCIASSLPALRRLQKRAAVGKGDSQASAKTGPQSGYGHKALVTIGGGVVESRGPKQSTTAKSIANLSSAEAGVHVNGHWQKLKDDKSVLHWGEEASGLVEAQRGIYVERAYTLEMEPLKCNGQ